MDNNLTFNSINKYFVICGLVTLQGISCSRSSRLSMLNWRDVLCCVPKKAKGLKPGEPPAGHAPNEPLTAGAVLEPLVKTPAGHVPIELLMDIFRSRALSLRDMPNIMEVSSRYCDVGKKRLEELFTQKKPCRICVGRNRGKPNETWDGPDAHVFISEQEFLKKETWENFRKSPIRYFKLWANTEIKYHEFSSIVDHFGEKLSSLLHAKIVVDNEGDFIDAKYLEDIAKLTKIEDCLSIEVRRGRSDRVDNTGIEAIHFYLKPLKGVVGIHITGEYDSYTGDKILTAITQLKNFNNPTDVCINDIRRISYQGLCSLLDKFPHTRFEIRRHSFSQAELQQLRNNYPNYPNFRSRS